MRERTGRSSAALLVVCLVAFSVMQPAVDVRCGADGLCVGAERAYAAPTMSVDADAAVDDEAGYGIDGFHRAKRGSASALPDGQQVGYRYITGDARNFALVATDRLAVLYVPADVCGEYGIELADPSQSAALLQLVQALDEAHADGSPSLEQLGVPVRITSDAAYVEAGLMFSFAVEAEGRTYAAVGAYDGEGSASAPGASEDGGAPAAEQGRASASVPDAVAAAPGGLSPDAGALFCDYGALVASADIGVVTSRRPLEELQAFFGALDWSPLLVSARTTLVATIVVAVLGLLAGWFTLRLGSRSRSLCDAIFTVPMILPPSVCGFLLLYAFGKNTAFGQWLISIGISLPFTWAAAVISAVVVSFPYMYRAARGAFENLDPSLMDCARTLGWSEPRVIARLMVPLARPALMAGVVLSFARALGEFGATLFFAGNYAGVTQTIPLAIYYDWMGGDAATAILWTVVVILFSAASMLVINRFSRLPSRSRRVM